LLGRGLAAGATFTLSAALLTGLFGAAAMLLASLPWYALALLVLVPLAARVPLPEKMPVWLQSILVSICALLPALPAFYLTWTAASGTTG